MSQEQEKISTAGQPILKLSNVSKHFGAVCALRISSWRSMPVKWWRWWAITARENLRWSKSSPACISPPTAPLSSTAGSSRLIAREKRWNTASPRFFQDLALCENLDVVANLFLGQEISPLQLDEVAMEVRAWTLLQELAARIPSVREPIASLSGGQRQTVAIARSLLMNPKIIMLDEPTAALGVAQTAEVLNLIERVRERGLGVIIISHNMEDVRAVADRIVVLRLGRNKGIFTPDASNQDLVAAITGATENAVSRRVERKSQLSSSGVI
nr:galactoside transport ATP-binding protein [Raoultella sp. NCTC 9187]